MGQRKGSQGLAAGPAQLRCESLKLHELLEALQGLTAPISAGYPTSGPAATQ